MQGLKVFSTGFGGARITPNKLEPPRWFVASQRESKDWIFRWSQILSGPCPGVQACKYTLGDTHFQEVPGIPRCTPSTSPGPGRVPSPSGPLGYHFNDTRNVYWMVHKLSQIYTANHATFLIQISKIAVQFCGNFWVTHYYASVSQSCPYVLDVQLRPVHLLFECLASWQTFVLLGFLPFSLFVCFTLNLFIFLFSKYLID